MRSTVVLAVLPAFVACTDAVQPSVEGTSHVAVFESRGFGPRQLDLLFIIDDTTAMAPYQERLATLPAALDEAFAAIGGGYVDTHIAVATTTNSELRRIPAVGNSVMTIRTEYDLARVTNFLGTLEDTFGLLAGVGAISTAANRPFETLRRVVEDNPDGLIRDNAYFGVIIITASDDASAEPPATYAQLAKASKADPANVFVSAITVAGMPRLDELFASLPNRHRVTSLADGDYTQALEVLGQLIRTIIPGTCWYVSDIDPETPGPQYECTFTTTIRGAQRVLPPCKLSTDQLCWTLIPSDDGCWESGAVKPDLPPYHFFTFVPPFRAECVVIE